jgi:hypothetical protein
MDIESRALSERSFIVLDEGGNSDFQEISTGHNKIIFLLEKRAKALENLAELWELGGLPKLFPMILKSELSVQCNIFDTIFTNKPRVNFVCIDNAEALLGICLKLAKSKSHYYAEVAGKCAGIILKEISQNLCNLIATNLHVEESLQVKSIKIFKSLESICVALKLHKRGIVELNEIEFFIEKISPRVASIKIQEDEENFFIK